MAASKEDTQNGTAVEILINEPYENEHGKGQYTHKVYHIDKRVPKVLKAVIPASMMVLEERAWNAYPYCKTVMTNRFMGERFTLTIESMHLSDRGQTDNVLKKRNVIFLDIAKSKLSDSSPQSAFDPTQYGYKGIGPLRDNWQKTPDWPMMCCYKMVTMKLRLFGLETTADMMAEKTQYNLFLKFHKQLFCLMHEWTPLTMEDIREAEQETKKQLEEVIDKLDLQTKGI